ncbi:MULTISPECIES: site-2 protease family protein [unclassified Streptomyces]|uniref:site-2 protease family protein n=1 Tax=unclassified Streptomyces TaxID=2593676 RepID=UPI00225AB5F4|nr:MULTISPECIES: site-2 protease family protein [unclassified Streptomyces]MCX4992079.1 site-2 protease family protein [Streptomyces sp. NBC_00568]MCX5002685.1 site-2 protease family protein [Streptomyces sp. NBC_00638]
MDESGGSGQPRSGTGEATEHDERPRASAEPAADATRTGEAGPETPTGPAPTAPDHDSRTEADTDRDTAAPDETATPVRAEAGSRSPAPTGPGADDGTTTHDGTGSEEHPETGPESAPGTGASRDPLAKAPAATEHTEHTEGTGAHGEPPETSDGPDRPHGEPSSFTARDDLTDAHRTLAHTGNGKRRPPRRPKEPGGGLLMGRPFGVPVYVAPSWFLVAALITWVFGGQLDRVLPELGAARYLVSLFFAVAFYASVLVHELAHTVAALRFKLPVRRIQLQFFGGVSEIEKEAETPGREFVLAFVGPLLSLVLSGVFYLAMLPVEPGTVPGVLLAGLMISNLIVAAFNLLPGLPLDGGRMLRAVVWKITGRPMSGTVAAAWVGRALAVSVLIGLPLLTQSEALGAAPEDLGGMDTVTDALLAAILAAIIWTGAGNSLRMARLREHLPELRARSLTRRAVPVETGTPLSEALRRANDVGARALVVVDADGEPLSLVREAAIVGVPEHRRPWVAVSGLAQDLTDGMRVSAELAGEDLLDALRASPATEYLVVEDSGEIYGVLSAADVERAFVKAMARPS